MSTTDFIPRVFIGSSTEGKKVANILEEKLKEGGKIEVTVWDTMFNVGDTYIERLMNALEEYDFAILIITGDDFFVRRNTQILSPRDNVLFELGLFMGKLGRRKAIMLYEVGEEVKLPSDLGGIHTIAFKKPSVEDKEAPEPHLTLEDSLKVPCGEIRNYLVNPYEDDIRVFKVWKRSIGEIIEAFEKAPKEATIRIIQTWFPDLEDFIEELEKLLIQKQKRFKFQIMLIDEKVSTASQPDLLDARIRHRKEKRQNAIENIANSIEQFKNLKIDVEKAWNSPDEILDLEIRRYDFLPFGPMYQIGDEVMFIGIYLNHCSSCNAPMLKIKKSARTIWSRFVKHFEKGWKGAETNIVFPEKTEDAAENIVSPQKPKSAKPKKLKTK